MARRARYYHAELNPAGAFFPGVPLRDLSPEELDDLPDWLVASILASDFYLTRRPDAVADAAAGADDGDEEGATDG